MAEYTVTIPLPDHKRGDLWPGIAAIGPVLINDAAPALALARVRMRFTLRDESYVLDSDATTAPDAPITLADAASWEVIVPEVMEFLPTAGRWAWDMEFYQAGKSAPLTLYQGTLTVHPDV